MSSPEYRPQTDNRDVGLGVAFFKHPYRSSEDHKIYHDYTRIPILGYCPGCSPNANMNLKSASSNLPTAFNVSKPSASTATSDHFTEADFIDYPEDGVLVTAETYHAGPSYTSDSQVIGDNEDRRNRLVKFVLNRWAKVDQAKKQREALEKEKAKMKEEEERRACEARINWDKQVAMQEEMLENAYASGYVNVAETPKMDHKDVAEVLNSVTKKEVAHDNDTSIIKERSANVEPVVSMTKKAKHKQTREPAGNEAKERDVGLGLGLVSYQAVDEGGLVVYDSDGDETHPIVID